MSLLKLFCDVDDFCNLFTNWQASHLLGPVKKPGPKPKLAASEIMTIIIYFHQSRYRDFKAYYTRFVMTHLRSAFPHLVSYSRFVELMSMALLPLCLYLKTRLGTVTGIAFIDAVARLAGRMGYRTSVVTGTGPEQSQRYHAGSE